MPVTFCGHGKINYGDKIKKELKSEIEKAIKKGESIFLLGGYGKFDLLAAYAIKELKIKYPYIKSILVIPYLNRIYDKNLYDESIYPSLENFPKKFAIIKRNEWTVNKSDIIIAYVEHNWGGAAKTLEYAYKKKIKIINLALSERDKMDR